MTQALSEVRPQAWTPNDSTFGARLALLRQAMKWNMTEAAQECGLNRENWRLWEEGRLPRDLVTVGRAIAERTGCDVDWLVMGPSRAQLQERMAVTPREPRVRRDVMSLLPPAAPSSPYSGLHAPLPDKMALASVGRPDSDRMAGRRPSLVRPRGI